MVNLTHDSRFDYNIITRFSPGERVLDLGYGDGKLLTHLVI
jgi:Methionine biosynthesis protein MetW